MQMEYPCYRPLVIRDKDENCYTPYFLTFNINNILSSHAKYYLKETVPNIYELCSKVPLARSEALNIKVTCPLCDKLLTPVMDYQDSTHLQKFICKHCQ